MVILERIYIIDLMYLKLTLTLLKEEFQIYPLLVEYFSEKISTNYNLKKLELIQIINIYSIMIGQVTLEN